MPLPVNRKNERFFLRKVREGHYSVSSKGVVVNEKTDRILDKVNIRGYIEISCKDKYGKARHILAHRLVWLVLKGDIPDDIFLNHKNGIKHDNRPKNLELVTNAENVQHAFDTGLRQIEESTKKKLRLLNQGEKGAAAIFSDDYVRKLRAYCHIKQSKGWSKRRVAKYVAKRSGHNVHSIRKILSNRCYKNVQI